MTPSPYFCGSRPVREIEAADDLLGQVAAHALGEDRVFAAQLHAAGEAVFRLAVAADAEIAGGDADDLAGPSTGLVDENLGPGKARIDLDSGLLGLAAEIAAHVAEGADEVAVVAHQARHAERRQPHAAAGAEKEKLVPVHLRREGAVRVGAPVRHEPVEPDRIDDGAGQDMGADLGALLDHDDREFGAALAGELLQADGRRETGRAGADHHDVEVHGFPFRQFHRFSSRAAFC